MRRRRGGGSRVGGEGGGGNPGVLLEVGLPEARGGVCPDPRCGHRARGPMGAAADTPVETPVTPVETPVTPSRYLGQGQSGGFCSKVKKVAVATDRQAVNLEISFFLIYACFQ